MICKYFESCPLREFEKKGVLEGSWKEKYCKNDFKSCRRFQMEEANQYHPDHMLPDGTLRRELLQ